MVEGRLRKFYEDVVLLEQTFALDEKKKVQVLFFFSVELCKNDGTFSP